MNNMFMETGELKGTKNKCVIVQSRMIVRMDVIEEDLVWTQEWKFLKLRYINKKKKMKFLFKEGDGSQ